MRVEYFEEMHKLSHDDDRRYLMLIRGVKMMLEERRNARLTTKLRRRWRQITEHDSAVGRR